MEPPKTATSLHTTLQNLGAKGKVRFADPPRTGKVQISLRNLYTTGKLCNYFQQPRNVPDPCVGFLEKLKTFKHFVYQEPVANRRIYNV